MCTDMLLPYYDGPVLAEESYWQDNPFHADDCPGSNSITHWWTRKGIGAQTINMFCRQGYEAARVVMLICLIIKTWTPEYLITPL